MTGCGQKIANAGTTLHITKSPTNTQKINVSLEDNKNLKELMDHAKIEFTTEMRGSNEYITKLAGVISTASKSWKLYINGKISNFATLSEIKINQPLAIEWRYEENK